ncbi:MAG: DEAD/DEAH box helicase, partial [Erysipelotrichaceae bacterium]|nr:DEAD/DEAH box helicase [Erysipelotrichaceae bacterium]
DRLLLGDVGFGKTEVAARAMFKAVTDSKQVAMLVPTTLLANQHYHTLKDRFENFPFTVDMLSRFRTDQEQQSTIKGTAKGTVDVVVGTHRLLSKDVQFKDLGLLIIDEEQRFGVRHKEAIKRMRKNVDVLTLSATPIPRTLHMSLPLLPWSYNRVRRSWFSGSHPDIRCLLPYTSRRSAEAFLPKHKAP